jgi:hypothetical protein
MIASVMDDGQLYPDYDHYAVYSAQRMFRRFCRFHKLQISVTSNDERSGTCNLHVWIPPSSAMSLFRGTYFLLTRCVKFKALSRRIAFAQFRGHVLCPKFRNYIQIPEPFAKLAAITHRLCRLIWIILHQGVSYEERGPAVSQKSKRRRTSRMIRELRSLGYEVQPLSV